jgi:hypothetical protein
MKIEAILLWLLTCLLAISLVGDYPLLGLAVGIVGGAMVGSLLVLDDIRRRAAKK